MKSDTVQNSNYFPTIPCKKTAKENITKLCFSYRLYLIYLFYLFAFFLQRLKVLVCVCVYSPKGLRLHNFHFTFSPSNLLFPSFYILNIELFQNYNIKNAPISQYVFQLFLSALPFNVFKKNNAPNLSNISKLSAIFIFYYKNLVLF